jgi:hypothetical protein
MLRWKRNDGTSGTQNFESEEEATAAARGLEGIALVSELPSGSFTVFRNGVALSGDDSAQAQDELQGGAD